MAQEAIELHLESLAKHDEKAREAMADKQLKGKHPLRMGPERHQRAATKAAQKGVSLNDYLLELIDRDVFPQK